MTVSSVRAQSREMGVDDGEWSHKFSDGGRCFRGVALCGYWYSSEDRFGESNEGDEADDVSENAKDKRARALPSAVLRPGELALSLRRRGPNEPALVGAEADEDVDRSRG